jgi:hypothetical protein
MKRYLVACIVVFGIILSFTHVAIGSPTLFFPADGAQLSGNNIVVAWERVPGVRHYRLQIARDPDFSFIYLDQSFENVNCVFVTGAPNDGSHIYWRVAENSSSTFSSVWMFINGPCGTGEVSASAHYPSLKLEITGKALMEF